MQNSWDGPSDSTMRWRNDHLKEFIDAGEFMQAVALEGHRQGWAFELRRRRDEPLMCEDVLAHSYSDIQMIAMQFSKCVEDLHKMPYLKLEKLSWSQATMLQYVLEDFNSIMELSTISINSRGEADLGDMVWDREYVFTWIQKLEQILPAFRRVAEALLATSRSEGLEQPMSKAEELWALRLKSIR